MSNFLSRAVCNTALVLCLLYIGFDWISSPSKPELDKVVYRFSLGNGDSIYGARDNRGGATVGFSYRYYTFKDIDSDEEVLKALVSKHPFLVTQEPTVSLEIKNGELHLLVKGRIYDFSSYILEDFGFTKVEIVL